MRTAELVATAGFLSLFGASCSLNETINPVNLPTDPVKPEATEPPTPGWLPPTLTRQLFPTPIKAPIPEATATVVIRPKAEKTPSPEQNLTLPKHTLLIKSQLPSDEIVVMAILPDGAKQTVPVSIFDRHWRPDYQGPDGSWSVSIWNGTDNNGRPKSEVRIRRSGNEGTAGYADNHTRLKGPIAISSILPSASYILLIQEAIQSNREYITKKQIKGLEGPNKSNHMLVLDLPEDVVEIRSMAFGGEWLYIVARRQNLPFFLYRLNQPIFHSLPPEETKDCPWAINPLSECLSRLNKATRRELVPVDGLPEGEIIDITEVVNEY